jgi:hypothetical protein
MVNIMTLESKFERELEVFRGEAESAVQFFYSESTIHAVAAERRSVLNFLNETPLFWRTCTGALQIATFIAIGRIFDQGSPHNIDRLLHLAEHNRDMFSKASLAKRKQGTAAERPDWLDEYIEKAYEPTKEDFRRLRRHIKKWRRIYNDRYRDLRHKVFAHKEFAEDIDTAPLWAKTSTRELEKLLAFLVSIHEALWQSFFNGRKPSLRPVRHSMKLIRRRPDRTPRAIQERMTYEVERFLLKSVGRKSRFDTRLEEYKRSWHQIYVEGGTA